MIAARREAARLWVTVVLGEQLRVTNYGKLPAYEARLVFRNVRVRIWGKQGEHVVLASEVLGGRSIRWDVEFPMVGGDEARVDLEVVLVRPLLDALARIPEYEFIKGRSPQHDYVSVSMDFDVEYGWKSAGPWGRRTRTREGVNLLFGLACGYDTWTKQWNANTYTIDAISVYPPELGPRQP